MGLCFGFVTKTVDDTVVFWLLLSSTCTALRLSLFPVPGPPGEYAGVGKKLRGRSQNTCPQLTEGIFHTTEHHAQQ